MDGSHATSISQVDSSVVNYKENLTNFTSHQYGGDGGGHSGIPAGYSRQTAQGVCSLQCATMGNVLVGT